MSQRKEKYARGVETRVEVCERELLHMNRLQANDGIQRQMEGDNTIHTLRRQQGQLRRLEQTARRLEIAVRLAGVALLLLSAAVIISVLTIRAHSTAPVLMPPMTATAADDGAGSVVRVLPCTTEEPAESEENRLIDEALPAHSACIPEARITHYCACVSCCGKEDGITATGLPAVEGVTVAVDPGVIPLGSYVYINGSWYVATDTGVTGDAVDIYVADHETALALGVYTADVYWVAPGGVVDG